MQAYTPLAATVFLFGLLAILLWHSRRRRHQLLGTIPTFRLPDFHSAILGNCRDIQVYLPPDHEQSRHRRFPVLYLNDGQDVAALKLRETLARLHQRGVVVSFITVAIPTNEDRLREYGTAIGPNAQGLGNRAGDYADFVTQELMPVIDAEFRADTRPGQTAILGASLGGLSAFDIAWNHRERFGTVGVMSGSFWWRAAEEEAAMPSGRRIVHSTVRQGEFVPGFRAWFQAATRDERDDRDGNGVIDAIQDTLELIDEMAALGYEPGEDMVYVQVEGGRHSYETWSRVLPAFLHWAFGAGR